MNKEVFEEPEVKITELKVADIIVTSGGNPDPTVGGEEIDGGGL